ncbi:MAG: NAD(P)/FAD-dependent oxidoreductase [Pseudomonadota bacterium]
MQKTDIIIIGAGAAGLMCAIEAGKRQRSVIVLEHANKPGKKILMSGGGRCNFTNYHCSHENFISHNPHFCKSALTRYTQWDFINLVKKHHIPFHEKILGQLFCDNKAKDILNMLLIECEQAGGEIRLNTTITKIEKISDHHFKIHSSRGDFHCQSLVIASGGLSIPTMGASPFGYQIAEQFGLKVWPTRAGLVPLTLHTEDKDKLAALSGIAVDSLVSNERQSFRENILFTHRGLSGPAILQLSSYWQPGEEITINMLPGIDLNHFLLEQKQHQSPKQLKTILSELLPKRLVELFITGENSEKKLAACSQVAIEQIARQINCWRIKPNGTEGYRTAEVTLGGVDCDALSSKTFEVTTQPGLYFIGEVLDVSGWLGGFNFQWAWSSGWAAGQVV